MGRIFFKRGLVTAGPLLDTKYLGTMKRPEGLVVGISMVHTYQPGMGILGLSKAGCPEIGLGTPGPSTARRIPDRPRTVENARLGETSEGLSAGRRAELFKDHGLRHSYSGGFQQQRTATLLFNFPRTLASKVYTENRKPWTPGRKKAEGFAALLAYSFISLSLPFSFFYSSPKRLFTLSPPAVLVFSASIRS